MTTSNVQSGPAKPILYSFRRCPYAIRARLALYYSGVQVELREVVLKNKPQELLDISPKATVPVLLLQDGTIIEESWKIIQWALEQGDPDGWTQKGEESFAAAVEALVLHNDGPFKYNLNGYKYPDRHPELPALKHREDACAFLVVLESRLRQSSYLMGERFTVADAAVFPFIRQFAHVDLDWFKATPYKAVNSWLEGLKKSPIFGAVMGKYARWEPGQAPVSFGQGGQATNPWTPGL